MAKSVAGYSGKPLGAKLGFKPGLAAAAINAPSGYDNLLGGLPDGATLRRGRTPADVRGCYGLVHLFCPDRAALATHGTKALALVASGGALWVSWPKKSSKLFRDLTEDGVRELVLPTGWVDVKVCAVDADWSGLKFLRRKTG